MIKPKRIYLDGAANSPLDKTVIKAMRPYLKPGFCGNSNSAHQYGAAADLAVTSSRKTIAGALGFGEDEIFFTSGATESNNWAIKGLALAELAKPEGERKLRIVVSATEHASVLGACDSLRKLGFDVVKVAPLYNGSVTLTDMRKAMRRNKTLLVCCMAVNNETGVANPVDEIGKAAHSMGAVMLSDMTQAMLLGGNTIRFGALMPHVDMFSFSSHKIYGPTGVGCLMKRADVPLIPLLDGGSQEGGLRGGTHNVAGIVGMAKAVENLAKGPDMSENFMKMAAELAQGVHDASSKANRGNGTLVKLNAMPNHPNILSLDFSKAIAYPGRLSDAFAAEGVAVSSGAACAEGGDMSKSHVLVAMRLTDEKIMGTVRISFTKYTTSADIAGFVEVAARLMARFPAGGGTGNE